MNAKLTTNHPDVIADAFPGATIKRNPRSVLHDIAIWAMLLDVIVGLILTVTVDNYDASAEVLVWIVAVAVALATSSAPLQYTVTLPETEEPEPEPVLAPAMSALLGRPVYFKEGAEPKNYAAGATIKRSANLPLFGDDIVDGRSFAEPTSYPIPPSIAAALGSKATAQIEKDTESHR